MCIGVPHMNWGVPNESSCYQSSSKVVGYHVRLIISSCIRAAQEAQAEFGHPRSLYEHLIRIYKHFTAPSTGREDSYPHHLKSSRVFALNLECAHCEDVPVDYGYKHLPLKSWDKSAIWVLKRVSIDVLSKGKENGKETESLRKGEQMYGLIYKALCEIMLSSFATSSYQTCKRRIKSRSRSTSIEPIRIPSETSM
jgi:hypothetical protein